jgi:ubiquinone/menaquinone biosynthesis C-methylase UbiE
MVSFREKYRLWRKRTLPASKADVTRLQESVRDEISGLRRTLNIDAEALTRRVGQLMRFANTTTTSTQNIQSKLKLGTKAVEEESLAFSYSKLSHTVSKPELVPHSKWQSYLSSNFNRPGVRILEVGSRNVTGGASKRFFSQANYVGFDFYEGENVDVVGDAHKLSSYFGDQRFDLIMSSAVFEHFHMPWIVAHEIQKLLRIGGYVFVETHFSFGTHERPWNFFQFSDMGLRALFNSGLGFELVDSGMSNPMNGVFSQEAEEYLRGKPVHDLYCHSEILCKKAREVAGFDWGNVEMDEVVNNTRYPAPESPIS